MLLHLYLCKVIYKLLALFYTFTYFKEDGHTHTDGFHNNTFIQYNLEIVLIVKEDAYIARRMSCRAADCHKNSILFKQLITEANACNNRTLIQHTGG